MPTHSLESPDVLVQRSVDAADPDPISAARWLRREQRLSDRYIRRARAIANIKGSLSIPVVMGYRCTIPVMTEDGELYPSASDAARKLAAGKSRDQLHNVARAIIRAVDSGRPYLGKIWKVNNLQKSA